MSRSILITGAASGIGAATARRLAGPGTRLLLHTRKSLEALDSVAKAAKEAGAEVETAIADLCKAGAGGELVEQAVAAFGTIDQIIANAGYAQRGQVGDVDRDDLDASLAAMPGALFDLTVAAKSHLIGSDHGSLVVVSSFVAQVFDKATPFAVTAAAKAAVEALVKTIAMELAENNVTVNAVAPGFTKKDDTGHSALGQESWVRAAKRTPTGRLSEPDDVAALIAFLLSGDARQITGQVIRVDGGLSLGI